MSEYFAWWFFVSKSQQSAQWAADTHSPFVSWHKERNADGHLKGLFVFLLWTFASRSFTGSLEVVLCG